MKKFNCIAEIDPRRKKAIAEWAYDVYHEYCFEFGIPFTSEKNYEIIKLFKEKLLEEKILLPDELIMKYYYDKLPGFQKRVIKDLRG